jgi:DNA repair photolyase
MADFYLSPRWSGEIADCSMPLTFDHYSNCAFKCIYCFSQYQRAICRGKHSAGKDDYLKNEVRPVNVKRVKRIFTEPGFSQFWPYIEDRKVFQWGGLSDPFCWFEKNQGVGLELLRFFRELDYPICFSTKGTWWLNDDRYVDLFRDNSKWNVKFSIITTDEAKAKKIEVGVPKPSERLKAIEKFSKLDAGGATLRFRPFIVGVSNPGHVDLVRLAGNSGATAVSTEFFCLEQRSPVLRGKMHIFDECCGFNVLEFYRKFSSGAGYLRLNRKIKKGFVDEMESAAREVGMRFYVSDAHFKERCDNGSCCGLPPDWNYSKGQFCTALVLCRKNGTVSWPEIAKDLDYAKSFLWDKAEGMNKSTCEKRTSFWGFTMFDYLRWLWNNPKAGQSPYTMFEGVMKPTGKDENGDLVYTYDPRWDVKT